MPRLMMTETRPCRLCGQPISFIRLQKGTTLPVDPEPVHFTPGGGPGKFISADGRVMYGRARANGQATGYIGHRTTCKYEMDEREERKRRKKT